MHHRKNNRPPRPFGFGRIALLGALCLLLAEAAACYVFAPTLFHSIADPIGQKAVAAVQAGRQALTALVVDLRRPPEAEAAAEESPPDPPAARSGDVTRAQDSAIITADGYYTNPATGDTVLTGGNVDVLFFNQTAPAWKDQSYGADPIGTHGCGPTAMAMAVSSLSDYRVDPKAMADWSVKHGFYARGGGSYHKLIPEAARAYGLTVYSCTDRTVAGLRAELDAGHLLVVLMRPGHFTDSGHFMLVRGVDADGNFLIADPQSFENSLTPWDPAIIVDELAARDGDGGPVWVIGSGIA